MSSAMCSTVQTTPTCTRDTPASSGDCAATAAGADHDDDDNDELIVMTLIMGEVWF